MAKRHVWLLMPLTALASLCMLLTYIVHRIKFVAQASPSNTPHEDIVDGQIHWPLRSIIMAWIFLSLELMVLVPHTLPYVLRILAIKPAQRDKRYLVGNGRRVPTIDVLITCCREDVNVIMDTVRAACVVDYPPERFRIFVCDDGGSSQLQDEIANLTQGCPHYPQVIYTARKKPAVKDYKAGNLNAALRFSRTVPWIKQDWSPEGSLFRRDSRATSLFKDSRAPSLYRKSRASSMYEEKEPPSPTFLEIPPVVYFVSKGDGSTERHVYTHDMFDPDSEPPSPSFVKNRSEELLVKDSSALNETDFSVPCRPRPAWRKSFHSFASTETLAMTEKEHPNSTNWGQHGAEFVAGLDADMIPEPGWLRTIMPHMLDDPLNALGCPPQTFYDIPDDDPLTQTMTQFAGMTEMVHDALGHADCLGSGYIMRREAVESIGGFPVESLSEDVCCSSTMLGAGWKTVFVPQALQYGSVPESFYAHLKQRTRWFVGHVQTAKLFNFRLFGPRGRYYNFKQRLVGMAFDFRQIIQVPLVSVFLLIPYAMLSGSPIVFWSTPEQLERLIQLVCVWSICHWLHQGVMGLISALSVGEYDLRTPSLDAEIEQWMGPYIAISFFRSFVLPKSLGGVHMGFTSTGSISSDLDERDPEKRAGLWRRLKVILIDHWALMHLVYIAACLGGVALTILRVLNHAHPHGISYTPPMRNVTQQITYLVTRIGWPPLFWLQHFISALTPILYAINPPTTPPRETLLDRNPDTGVAYPKDHVKKPMRTRSGSWRYLRAFLAMIYTVILLAVAQNL